MINLPEKRIMLFYSLFAARRCPIILNGKGDKTKQAMTNNILTAWVTSTTVKTDFKLSKSPLCAIPHCPRISFGSNIRSVPSYPSMHTPADPDNSDNKTPNVESNPVWQGDGIDTEKLISKVTFNDKGLVAAIAQQWDSDEVLMMAWMNAESIRETMRYGRVVYFSRSRQQLWRKGDTSGQVQFIRDMVLDCDGDTLLLKVDQVGVACHTGRRSCFYTAFRPPAGDPLVIAEVLMDPNEMYKSERTNK